MSSVPADLSSRPGTASEPSSIDDFSSESEHDGTNVLRRATRKRKTGPLNDDGTKMNRDERTAYYRRLRNELAAETAEAEALSPEARAQKQIDEQSGSILEHLKPRTLQPKHEWNRGTYRPSRHDHRANSSRPSHRREMPTLGLWGHNKALFVPLSDQARHGILQAQSW